MMRDPEVNTDKATITVETIDGNIYANRDMTTVPLGQNERVVAFWDDDGVLTIPMHRVKTIHFKFDG